MSQQKKTRLAIGIASIVSAILFVVLLVVGIIYNGGALAKTLLIIISVLVLALAAELGYLYFLFGDIRPNYFLFNSKTNRNNSVQKLTFQTVNVRMNRYLASYASSEGKIWTDRVFDNPSLEMDDVFKPLVAYKLLYDLAERDFDAGWKCFDLASDETVEFICAAIEMNGDTEVAGYLRQFKAAKPTNLKYVRDYLVKNRKYLQSKMFRYTVDNIEKF
ncbi:MAG: hypothetical protein E7679_02190 [Ruminococcaceae bacterium]|nr:hypothetical protein [Oscillospiraceae bacterium]